MKKIIYTFLLLFVTTPLFASIICPASSRWEFVDHANKVLFFKDSEATQLYDNSITQWFQGNGTMSFDKTYTYANKARVYCSSPFICRAECYYHGESSNYVIMTTLNSALVPADTANWESSQDNFGNTTYICRGGLDTCALTMVQ